MFRNLPRNYNENQSDFGKILLWCHFVDFEQSKVEAYKRRTKRRTFLSKKVPSCLIGS